MERKKVLVVDDEEQLATLIKMRLEANGFAVVTASDGSQGLEMAVLEQPNLILLDVMMPKMDGHEVLRRLKYSEQTRHIPVAMLTARGDTSSILKAQEMGAKDYLIKPFESDELVEFVKQHVG